MKITIKVEQQIPYCRDSCVVEQQIDWAAFETCRFDFTGQVIWNMIEQVNQAVDVAVEKRRAEKNKSIIGLTCHPYYD